MSRRGVMAVLLITVVSLVASLAMQPLLAPLEEISVDVLMRWRVRLLPAALRSDTDDILLTAIDEHSESVLGRFGSGIWVARQPYVRQFRFLRNYVQPSVLAYDIILKETAGRTIVPDDEDVSGRLRSRFERVFGDSGSMESFEEDELGLLSRLLASQSDLALAHSLAGIMEQGMFDVVLGCNLRGGWGDEQHVTIPYWSESEEGSRQELYLRYFRIPDQSVTFASNQAAEDYQYAVNGGMPSRDLLDYSVLGVLNVPREDDGVIRRIPLVFGVENRLPDDHVERYFIPTFPLISVLLHEGITAFPLTSDVLKVVMGQHLIVNLPSRRIVIPIDDKGRMLVNYRWHFSDFDAISFSETAPLPGDQLMQARRYGDVLRDRLVVAGVTTTGVDVGPTPIHPNIPLVYVQMSAMNTILTESFLYSFSREDRIRLMLAVAVLFAGISLPIRSFRVTPALALLLIVYWLAGYASLHYDLAIVPLALPTFFHVTASFWLLTYRYFAESRARREIRTVFSAMVSDPVLQYLENHPKSFSLEGHTTDVTVLFADIVEFTRWSERLPPEALIGLLNTCLTPVTETILRNGGYLDKYVGDCVMAVWGAPYHDEDHAQRACRTALEIQECMDRVNQDIEAKYGIRLAMRIGINSGVVTAGNMGSNQRYQYTVIGDAVNLASRLEAVNRDVGTRILVGDETAKRVVDGVVLRRIGRIQVLGRQQAATAYELVGQDADAALRQQLSRYESALTAFEARAWDEADAIIAELETSWRQDDGPTLWLLERIRGCLDQRPGEDWSDVYIKYAK